METYIVYILYIILYYVCILAMGVYIVMYMGVTTHKVEVTRTKGDNVLCLLLRFLVVFPRVLSFFLPH